MRDTLTEAEGRANYEADVARRPFYPNGSPRPAWEDLREIARWSWTHPVRDN